MMNNDYMSLYKIWNLDKMYTYVVGIKTEKQIIKPGEVKTIIMPHSLEDSILNYDCNCKTIKMIRIADEYDNIIKVTREEYGEI